MADRIPDSNLPSVSQQWGREMQRRLESLERGDARRTQNEINAAKGQNGTLGGLSLTIARLPAILSDNITATGFALAGTSGVFATYASLSFVVPAGKTFARLLLVGGAAVADRTAGGVPYASARFLVNTTIASPAFPSAKDAGASVVNNVMSPNFGVSLAVTEGQTITIALQLTATNIAAYTATAGNFASVSAIGVFSNPEIAANYRVG